MFKPFATAHMHPTEPKARLVQGEHGPFLMVNGSGTASIREWTRQHGGPTKHMEVEAELSYYLSLEHARALAHQLLAAVKEARQLTATEKVA